MDPEKGNQIDKAYLQVFLSIICRLVIDINLTGIFETLVCISSNVSWPCFSISLFWMCFQEEDMIPSETAVTIPGVMF